VGLCAAVLTAGAGWWRSLVAKRCFAKLGLRNMNMKRVSVAVLAASLSCQALAAPMVLYPVQTGAETQRYLKGVPTLSLETPTGAVQVTPLPFDRGHVSVAIAVYNKGDQPFNFGIENISASFGGKPIIVLSSAELQRRAKNRAMWSQIGVALLAGAAAYGASQSFGTSTGSGFVNTPRGIYSWTSTYRDNTAAILGTAAATAAGTAAIVGIQNRLDFTLASLADQIIQTTTVDPDSSYGGRVIIEKDPKAKLPFDFRIAMTLNGVEYPFVFRVTREGVSVPPPFVVASNVPADHQQGGAVAPMPAGVTGSQADAGKVLPETAPAITAPTAAPPVGQESAPVAVAAASPPPAPVAMAGPPRAAANTLSGYCLDVPKGYAGTGSAEYPILTTATPACSSLGRK
jgi:hypothetical protein